MIDLISLVKHSNEEKKIDLIGSVVCLCLLVKITKKILFFCPSDFSLFIFCSTIKIQRNMSTAQKKCGKCEKIVYPAEEIKCLDKVNLSFQSFFLFFFLFSILIIRYF